MKIHMPSLLAASLLALTAASQAQWLVSEDEALQSRAAPVQPVARSAPAPNAPKIELLAPSLGANIGSPTRILVRFEPGPQASIRPETFKVLYGAFRLDITHRITAASTVGPEGIDVSEARLPKGSHRLLLAIQDSAGRVGERTVSFVVD